uniref:Uncharacterized protein n=1 Tax=Rhizophora mucronata TaxID=61149 RepID=A0A2P2PA07_RHIMU
MINSAVVIHFTYILLNHTPSPHGENNKRKRENAGRGRLIHTKENVLAIM